MKFGQVFKQALRNEGFPPEWIDAAISYRQLKKCINRLTRELEQLGLDTETLDKLLRHVEDYNASAREDNNDRPFEYILSDPDDGPKTFHPKLLLYVDEATGALHSARLDKKTKRKLQMLAAETGLTDVRVSEESDESPCSDASTIASHASQEGSHTPLSSPRGHPGFRTVEVPLTSDVEFFSKLSSELSGLEALQDREEKRMNDEVEALGKQIARLTDPDRRANRKLLAVWRSIFQMYVEEGIFFGTVEADHSAHDAALATKRYQAFLDKVAQAGLLDKLKKKESREAMDAFLRINSTMLQGLRFGEINHTAMSKILKKFDKRTALGVKSNVPKQILYPSFSEHLAKAVCAQVSTSILSHIPQLDDYTCPTCMELEWRPVRLSCGHVFCIRCLIVMQTKKQDKCPLCRQATVRAADSGTYSRGGVGGEQEWADAWADNLDNELAAFLKKWFPEEVRQKQKYNEMMAGIDQYGEVYAEKCVVM